MRYNMTYLLGVTVHRLGIVTDWGSYYWCIHTEKGTQPLDVKYNRNKHHRIVKIEEEASDSERDTSETSEGEYSEGFETSYLLLPCVDEEAETNYYVHPSQNLQVPPKQGPSTPEEIKTELDKSIERCDLNETNKEKLQKVLYQYFDCFGLDYKDLKQTDLLQLHIDTGGHRPIMKRPNRYMSHAELDMFKTEVETMVSNGQLIPATHAPNKEGVTNGGWAFPALYVKKKTGERRLCVQFQELNAVTVKDSWPLPSIADLLESFSGSSIFSTMDLLKGFNQIKVAEDSIQKLTMATPWGCFSFKVMPFGIVNGPATFSRAIYLAMQGYLNDFVSTYIDDITVYSKEFSEHLGHLVLVLQRLREVQMILKPSKCCFAKSEVEVLGFIVSEQGIKPHPSNVKKILDFPRPKNKTDIRAFVSLAGFYRRHIQAFSDVIAPLNKLLSKKFDFHWDEEKDQAFRQIQECIINATILKYPEPNKLYKLYTDASDIGLGAVLVQFDEILNEDRPICFLSRKLMVSEMNYPTVEKELLAVIYALKKLRKYLLDKSFELYTDNTAVRYLFCKMDPGQKLQRWVLAVQEYIFKVYHLPGKSNVVADVLSRYPPSQLDLSDQEALPDALYPCWFVEEKDEGYEEGLNDIVHFLKNPTEFTHENEYVRNKATKYKLNEKGELYRRLGEDRFVKIPKIVDREAVLREVHDGHGHFGQEATWSRMFAIDYVGPFPPSKKGNKCIIVAIEYFTRWPVAKAVKTADSKTTVDFLYEEIFCQFGPPQYILSDNGTHFVSAEVEAFVKFVNVRHQYATPYHPQTNGRVEQFNGTLVNSIRKLVNSQKSNWDDILPTVLYGYRTKAHAALGISPFELMYGVVPNGPENDVLLNIGQKLAMERLYYLNDRNLTHEVKKAYQRIKDNKATTFPIGTKVIRMNQLKKNKLDYRYKPKLFTVLAAFANNVYILADPNGVRLKRAVNGANLKKFVQRRPLHKRLQDRRGNMKWSE
ncbi:hypothetical protein G6F33_011500 [Rhizopus arrhizus]|nr:hypothetical protein G6F24_011831 [Rhizopus arrhizus]KAG0906288.1 hypothetical protein G6F33_011500 [Rhizopus arrhizus]